MIEARELRLGNYVDMYLKTSTGLTELHEVEPTTLMMISGLIDNRGVGFKPIPLTEQWLFDFGFEKVNEGVFHKTAIGRITLEIVFFDGEISVSIENNVGMGFNSVICTPDQVHLLQNFWHSFTREELTKK